MKNSVRSASLFLLLLTLLLPALVHARPSDAQRVEKLAEWAPLKQTRYDSFERTGGAPNAGRVSRAGQAPIVVVPRSEASLLLDPKLVERVTVPLPDDHWKVELLLGRNRAGVLQIGKEGLGVATNVVFEGPPNSELVDNVARIFGASWSRGPTKLVVSRKGDVTLHFSDGSTEMRTAAETLDRQIVPPTSQRASSARRDHVARR